MRAYSLSYIIKDAFHNIRKNALMSVASISVLAACLVMMGSSFLITKNVDQFLTTLKDENEIVVFIDETVDDESLKEIERKIKEIPNIQTVEYISAEQAFEDYKNSFEDPSVFDGLENPLRDSFNLKLKDLNIYDSTIYSLKKIKGIDRIRSDAKIIEGVLQVDSTVTMIFGWIMVILLIVSLFIISNTIRLAMFTRRTEINIMKYVGATDNFIRLPFLVEGAVIGLLAALVSYGLQYYIYKYILLPLLSKVDIFSPVIFQTLGWQLFGFFAVFGILCGVAGSMFPMRKYLRV